MQKLPSLENNRSSFFYRSSSCSWRKNCQAYLILVLVIWQQVEEIEQTFGWCQILPPTNSRLDLVFRKFPSNIFSNEQNFPQKARSLVLNDTNALCVYYFVCVHSFFASIFTKTLSLSWSFSLGRHFVSKICHQTDSLFTLARLYTSLNITIC